MKISACVIMKDAARDIGECLESLKDGVDEIIVTDTGSTDDSVEIARRYTDKIFFFQWCDDFSAARNYCLEQATGDWIVFLDSDEYITEDTRDNLRKVVEGLDRQGFDRVRVCWLNVEDDYTLMEDSVNNGYVVRLFRNDPLRRYRDPIHEHLEYKGEGEDRDCDLDEELLCVHHKGYGASRSVGKEERNLRLLEQMKDKGQEKALLDFYLANMYAVDGEYEKALVHVKRAEEAGNIPDIAVLEIWRVWDMCLKGLDRSLEEREEMVSKGLKEYPEAPDLHRMQGEIYLEREEYAKAWESFRKVERLMSPEEFSRNFPLEANVTHGANIRSELYRQLSELGLQLGKKDMAFHYAKMQWETEAPSTPLGYSGQISPKSRCVVEFACGKGETGAAFRRRNPACLYVGVEENRSYGKTAKRKLSDVFEAVPEDADLSPIEEGSVDCILYQDRALHGLTTEKLRNHARCLSPEGQIIFLPENPGYVRRLTGLLALREEKEPCSGRTVQEISALAENVGLRVLQVEPVFSEEDEAEKRRPGIRKLLDGIQAWCREKGVEPRNDPWVCRYIIKTAKRVPEERLFLRMQGGGDLLSDEIRAKELCRVLQAVPGVVCQGDGGGSAERGNFSGRVVVRRQKDEAGHKAALREISRLRKEKCLIVCDMDALPGKNPRENADILGAHVLQVPARALADELKPYHPHVAVFRNELEELPPARQYEEKEPLTVFFGGRAGGEDWKDILPVLNETAKEYGKKLRFRVISDRAFFDALETEHKKFIGNDAYCDGKLVPRDMYRKVLGESDIALLPLRDTEENRMKSDIRFLDAAACGAAVLASPVVYGETVRDGETGFLYRNEEEFREKFRILLENREKRIGMAKSAYDYVKAERMLSQHYEERLAFYREMLGRWEELDRELGARLKRLK